MGTPNFYDLSGASIRVGWYPKGKGGPIVQGGPPANAPVLIFSNGSIDATVWGDDLKVSGSTPAGTFVTAIVKKTNIVPGAQTSFALLAPDVIVDGAPVTINTLGILSVHRGTADLGPGQLETYTETALKGTAAHIILPA